MNRGYVKVWRKIEDSGLIQLPNTLALFMHLLLNATHKARKVGTPSGVIELKRGQFISGRIALASRLEQTERQVRTSITRLEELGIISIQTTNKFSIYTIENYNKYQDSDEANVQQNDQQATNNRPADDQQTTTKQELNNLNIKEKQHKPSQANACPFDALRDAYHELMPANPRCKVLNKDRKSAMQARWDEAAKFDFAPFGYSTTEEGLAAWIEFFKVCNESKFLTGQVASKDGKPNFIANIDFLFSPSGFTNSLENKYHRD
jgi:biotin operon repressor